MAVTVLEMLECAQINVDNVVRMTNHPIAGLAKMQLDQALKAIEDGLGLYDPVHEE